MNAPIAVTTLFWNTDPAKLQIDRDASLIVSTLLVYGGQPALVWLFATYGRDRVRNFLLADIHGLQTLPSAEAKLWARVLNLPSPVLLASRDRWRPTRQIAP
jgi:hypothetical protein